MADMLQLTSKLPSKSPKQSKYPFKKEDVEDILQRQMLDDIENDFKELNQLKDQMENEDIYEEEQASSNYSSQ